MLGVDDRDRLGQCFGDARLPARPVRFKGIAGHPPQEGVLWSGWDTCAGHVAWGDKTGVPCGLHKPVEGVTQPPFGGQQGREVAGGREVEGAWHRVGHAGGGGEVQAGGQARGRVRFQRCEVCGDIRPAALSKQEGKGEDAIGAVSGGQAAVLPEMEGPCPETEASACRHAFG